MFFGFFMLLVFILVGLGVDRTLGYGISPVGHWWNLGLVSLEHLSKTPAYMIAPRPLCLRETGLSTSQARLCQRFFDHMPVVSVGAKIGIEECHNRFKYRQWNCTSEGKSVAFGPAISQGTREAGFAHAVSAAGVVHALARSCKEGRIRSCSCGDDERPAQLHRDWIWGGCGDNIKYAYDFAMKFIDAREQENSYPRGSEQLARTLMNLHNNRAGRLSVYKSAHVSCKCHGVSGSCSLRTCWTQLPPFGKIGEYLQEKYDKAVQVGFNQHGTLLRRMRRDSDRSRITSEDLVFLHGSPDYCRMDPSTGKPQTSGRECKLSTDNYEESCDRMCCGRGYTTHSKVVTEQCVCRFHWCCKVECQTCHNVVHYQICN